MILPVLVHPGVPLDPGRNSLNLLRLVFAIIVIASHATYLGGFMTEPTWGPVTPGRWAVIGFFIISGYLVTGSRNSRRLGGFLVRRIARIYPGFLVNILLTVMVFAPFGFYVAHHTLSGYATTDTTPLHYVISNLGLKMTNWNVADTPADVPYAGVWNGPLWTLLIEFACYVIVGLLLCVTVIRRRQQIFIPALFIVSVIIQWQATPVLDWVQAILPKQAYDISMLMQLLPSFLAGATIYQFRSRLRYSLSGALICAVVSVGAIIAWPTWGPQLVSPLLGYVIFWLACLVPMPRILHTEDISYGMYIYGFLVQQSLVLLGCQRSGLPAFTVASIVCTLPLAIASWVIVERPTLRLVKAGRHIKNPSFAFEGVLQPS